MNSITLVDTDFSTYLPAYSVLFLNHLDEVAKEFKTKEQLSKELIHNNHIKDRCARISCIVSYPFRAFIGAMGMCYTGTLILCCNDDVNKGIYNKFKQLTDCKVDRDEGCYCFFSEDGCILNCRYKRYSIINRIEEIDVRFNRDRLRGLTEINCRTAVDQNFIKERMRLLLDFKYFNLVNKVLINHKQYEKYKRDMLNSCRERGRLEQSIKYFTRFSLLDSGINLSRDRNHLILNIYRFVIASDYFQSQVINFPKCLLDNILADYLIDSKEEDISSEKDTSRVIISEETKTVYEDETYDELGILIG